MAALAVLPALALGAQPAAAGTTQWPHFLTIHVQRATANTHVVIDANYAGIRWTSQPGVVADDYLVRVDQSGFVHSLDNKLTFWRQAAPGGNDLVVRVTEPAGAGEDTFSYGVNTQPMTPKGTTYAGPQGNAVTDASPAVPSFSLPMDFILNVGGVCNPATFLQVELEWTNKVWRTADGIQPGLYRIRVMADASVVSLDGGTSFQAVTAQPWDWNHQILGVMVAGACDSVNNGGVDIVGYDRHGDGTFTHMTTWAQQPDGGYAWQPQNCGQSGACAAQPRESFAAGNYIVQTRYNPSLVPHPNGGGAPAPPTPAPVTTPTTARARAAAKAAPRPPSTPIAAPSAPVTTTAPSPAAAPVDTSTTEAPTTTTAAPERAALAVPSTPADHKSTGSGALPVVAAAVLLAASGGSVVALRRARRT
jgi:hypothetical protein